MRTGALVISLDFELAWGVFDTLGYRGAYRRNLFGALEAVPRTLELFHEFEVSATWAAVGLLFASSREEALVYAPPEELRPMYADPRLDPYQHLLSAGPDDHPLLFAPELLRAIAATPGQELGSHTFSHYYALEPGQTYASFTADLVAAAEIARASGHELKALVMPRHQTRPDYLPAYTAAGFRVHRGNEPNFLNFPRAGAGGSLPVRGLRLADSYVNLTGNSTVPWEELLPAAGLQDVPESRFLRPPGGRLQGLRLRRIIGGMTEAARRGRIFHLWWHPHNFGHDVESSIADLRTLLEAFRRLRDERGLRSVHMTGAAETAELMVSTA